MDGMDTLAHDWICDGLVALNLPKIGRSSIGEKANFFWMGNLLQLDDGLHLESQQTFKWPSHVLSFISPESGQMHAEVETKRKANNSCIDIENWWLGLGLARKVQPTQGLKIRSVVSIWFFSGMSRFRFVENYFSFRRIWIIQINQILTLIKASFRSGDALEIC